MTTTATHPEALTRSNAILRILDAMSTTNSNSVERLILEGFAYIATQPPYSEKNCRVLRAFHSKDWLLNFHESLAYLQEIGRVELIAGKYALTPSGRGHLCSIATPPELDVQYETDQIHEISKDVRERLGL